MRGDLIFFLDPLCPDSPNRLRLLQECAISSGGACDRILLFIAQKIAEKIL